MAVEAYEYVDGGVNSRIFGPTWAVHIGPVFPSIGRITTGTTLKVIADGPHVESKQTTVGITIF
jgi:hypothetical protein